MGGKTVYSGTSHDLSPGKAYIDGTVHNIYQGQTVIDGTKHNIFLKSTPLGKFWEFTLDGYDYYGTGSFTWICEEPGTYRIIGTGGGASAYQDNSSSSSGPPAVIQSYAGAAGGSAHMKCKLAKGDRILMNISGSREYVNRRQTGQTLTISKNGTTLCTFEGASAPAYTVSSGHYNSTITKVTPNESLVFDFVQSNKESDSGFRNSAPDGAIKQITHSPENYTIYYGDGCSYSSSEVYRTYTGGPAKAIIELVSYS